MDINQILENLTEEEAQAILDTQFPEELEKEAQAEVAKMAFAEALYAYGAVTADMQAAEFEEDLSKEASEQIESAYGEIVGELEETLNETGILESEDEVELHKEAQAAAAIMFEGYMNQIEKIAAKKPGVVKKMVDKMSKGMKAVGEKAKAHAGKAAAYAKKHPGKVGAGAAVAAGLGALAYKKKKDMDKKASELTVAELTDLMSAEAAFDAVVFEGIEKCAAKGASKAGMLAKAYEAGKKHVGKAVDAGKKHLGKAMDAAKKHKKAIGIGAGAGAAGALGGYAVAKKKD